MPITFGTAVQPAAVDTAERLPVLSKRQRPAFHLMVNKDNWTWDLEEKCYFPDLGKLQLSGGVNGVAIDDNGQEDDSHARGNYMKKGWRIVENGDPRLEKLVPGGRYLVRFPAKGYGHVYGCYWEGYEIVRGRVIWATNREAKVEFLQALVSQGFVAPMHNEIRKMNITDYKTKLQAIEARYFRYPNNVHLDVRIKVLKELIEDLEVDYAMAIEK